MTEKNILIIGAIGIAAIYMMASGKKEKATHSPELLKAQYPSQFITDYDARAEGRFNV